MLAMTTMAVVILQQFIDGAEHGTPHMAVDSLLAIAERMERDQGGRLTEFQARVFAAFLLGASRLPADEVDPEIVPEWLLPEDEARYAEGQTFIPPGAGTGLTLTRH